MDSPSRNIRRELLVALVALVTLAIGVTFAVVLTADTFQDSIDQTATIAAALVNETVESMSPTKGPTPEATGPTALEATTTTASITQQPAATATPTPILVSTDSPLPPATDDNSTPTPSAPPPSPTPTSPTNNRQPSPTNTLRPSATRTPQPPTATRRPATATATIVLSTPMTPSPSAEESTPGTCSHPAGWRAYTVRSGDNLFRISIQAGVSLAAIQEANCITDAAELVAGTSIYVPASFFNNASTDPAPTADISASQIPRQTGCTIPLASISAPAPDTTLSNRFTVRGTAMLDESGTFNFYKVEIRREDQSVFRNVSQSSVSAPGPNSDLAVLNPADFGPGIYQIVLTVVDNTGNYPEPCAIRVTFR